VSLVLRPAHRHLGVTNQVGPGHRAARADGDADRAGGNDVLAGELERLGQRGEDPLCHPGRSRGVGHLLQEDDELVPAVAAQAVLVSQTPPEPIGHSSKQEITVVAPKAVAYKLEAVDAHGHDRDGESATARSRHGLVQHGVEEPPHRQPGQPIAQSGPGEPRQDPPLQAEHQDECRAPRQDQGGQ
jgi:hypothetical protein